MHWLDSTFLALFALGAVLGFASGFLRQIARIASLALSLLGTIVCHDSALTLLQDHVLRDADPRIIEAVAYVTVFLAIYVVLYLTTRVLHDGISQTEMERVDRLLGALLGAGKMSLILGTLCLAASHYPHPSTHELMAKSTLAPALVQGMNALLVIIPDEYKDNVRETLVNLRDVLHRPAAEPKTADETRENAPLEKASHKVTG